MSLYKKHRPTDLAEIVGNQETVASVDVLLDKNFPQATLLSGPTGCGKTTLARIISKRLGAKHSDRIEIDVADFRGIDTVRNIIRNTRHTSLYGLVKVYIMDEVHKLTNDAQNALLKILEDTPPHVYFILCTTDPKKLIKTILGRCLHYEMQLLSERDMNVMLKSIIKRENEDVDREVIDTIIDTAGGHPRNAIQLLEKALSVPTDQRKRIIEETALQETQSIELCRLLIKGSGWKAVRETLNDLKDQDPEGVRRHVMGYCQTILLKEDNERAGLVMEMFVDPFYNTGFPELVFASYKCIKA